MHTHTPICIEVLIIIWQYVRNPVIKCETTYAYAGSCERESERWVVLRHRRVLLLLLQPVTTQSKTKSVRAPLLLLLLLHLLGIIFIFKLQFALVAQPLNEATYTALTENQTWKAHREERNEPVFFFSFFFFFFYIYLFICRLLQCCFFHSVCVSCARLMDLDALHRLLMLFFLFCPCFSFPFWKKKKYAQQDEHKNDDESSRVESLSSARIVTVLYT